MKLIADDTFVNKIADNYQQTDDFKFIHQIYSELNKEIADEVKDKLKLKTFQDYYNEILRKFWRLN